MAKALRVGSRVGVRFGDEVRVAVVIEDRGSLGPGGERLLRVRLEMPANAEDEAFEIEVPVSWLQPAPSGAGAILAGIDRPGRRSPRQVRPRPTLA